MDPISYAAVVINVAKILVHIEYKLSGFEGEELKATLQKTISVIRDLQICIQETPDNIPSESYTSIFTIVQLIGSEANKIANFLETFNETGDLNLLLGSSTLSTTVKLILAPDLERLSRLSDTLLHVLAPLRSRANVQASVGALSIFSTASDTGISASTIGSSHYAAAKIKQYTSTLSARSRKSFNRTNFVPGRNGSLRLPIDQRNDTDSLGSLDVDIQEFFGDGADAALHMLAQPIQEARDKHQLRLLICGIDSNSSKSRNTITFSRESYVTMMENLQLPSEFLDALLAGTPVIMQLGGPERQDGSERGREIFVMRMPLSSSNNWTLALSFNQQDHLTYGILHGLQENEREDLLSALQEFKSLPGHPLMLPVLLCELLTESDSNKIKMHASNLYQVELQTNYLRIDRRGKDSELGKHETPEDIFEDLTRKLNAITSRLAFHEMRINSNVTLVQNLKGHVKRYADLVIGGDVPEGLISVCEILSDRLQNLQVEHTALLLEISCNLKIAQGQLQIIFNLIAQRDNLENLRMASLSTTIASITREDSFAMRTIAVMTVAFLPATAISSIFSMSMFNWQASSGDPVLSNRFWIYWAVAIPLTLFVLGIWRLWMQNHGVYAAEETSEFASKLQPGSRPPKPAPKSKLTRLSFLRRRFIKSSPKKEGDHEQEVGQHRPASPQPSHSSSHSQPNAPARADTFQQGPLR